MRMVKKGIARFNVWSSLVRRAAEGGRPQLDLRVTMNRNNPRGYFTLNRRAMRAIAAEQAAAAPARRFFLKRPRNAPRANDPIPEFAEVEEVKAADVPTLAALGNLAPSNVIEAGEAGGLRRSTRARGGGSALEKAIARTAEYYDSNFDQNPMKGGRGYNPR